MYSLFLSAAPFFCNTAGNIKKEVDELFDDVVEDFCSLPVIMKHFEEWKFSRDKTYTEAFIPLSAQKVFVPFVRREMVFWNPLEVCVWCVGS